MTEIIAVVVGAILGYAASWMQQGFDRRRRRKGFATAMLLELRRVERNLREIAQSPQAAHASVEFPLLAHRQATSQLDAFSPNTAGALFDFLSCVADVEHGMSLFASGRVQRTPDRAWEQQCRAAFAANRVDALKAALIDEGGTIVSERDIARELTQRDQAPRLDPPSFPQPIRSTSSHTAV